MGKIQSYRELRVWKAAIDLAEKVYQISKTFPKHELYGLTSQMQRAAVSIPSNIAEGFGRFHMKEYLHFLKIAFGSLSELETQIELAKRFGYIESDNHASLLSATNALGKQLTQQRKSLNESISKAEE